MCVLRMYICVCYVCTYVCVLRMYICVCYVCTYIIIDLRGLTYLRLVVCGVNDKFPFEQVEQFCWFLALWYNSHGLKIQGGGGGWGGQREDGGKRWGIEGGGGKGKPSLNTNTRSIARMYQVPLKPRPQTTPTISCIISILASILASMDRTPQYVFIIIAESYQFRI